MGGTSVCRKTAWVASCRGAIGWGRAGDPKAKSPASTTQYGGRVRIHRRSQKVVANRSDDRIVSRIRNAWRVSSHPLSTKKMSTPIKPSRSKSQLTQFRPTARVGLPWKITMLAQAAMRSRSRPSTRGLR